jgi:hypothetical protein
MTIYFAAWMAVFFSSFFRDLFYLVFRMAFCADCTSCLDFIVSFGAVEKIQN